MKNGGWVFISHSHRDIEKVRRIRNQLEKLGFEPLMFYLKCLSDEDEIEELIKREIDEREWFIYADSPNARASKWVQTEREHIETHDGKRVFTVDLNADIDEQLRSIEHIARQMRVFLSYSHKDRALADRIREKLLERDMLVLDEESALAGEEWMTRAAENVEAAAKDGFIVFLVSESSLCSPWVKKEVFHAVKAGGKVVPVFIGKASFGPDILEFLGENQGVSIAEEPTDEELDKIVDLILHRVEYYDSDFTSSLGFRGAKTVRLPAISRIDNMTFWDAENLECVYIPDSVAYITPDAFAELPDILIKCSKDSYAERYCQKHGIRYEYTE